MAEDREWILAIVRRYERPLVAYVRGLLGDAERSRDVVQDAFLKLCKLSERRRKALEPRLAPWLFAVCRRRAIDILRKEQRMTAVPAYAEEKAGFDPEPSDAAEL